MTLHFRFLKRKNFLLIEPEYDKNLIQIQGIINGKKVHIHVSGKYVHCYEGTEKHLDVKITEGLV